VSHPINQSREAGTSGECVPKLELGNEGRADSGFPYLHPYDQKLGTG